MQTDICEICSKKIYKFYELKLFPINIYHNKKKNSEKKLKIFLCKNCNHISISKIKLEESLYKSYKKKFLSKYSQLGIKDKKKKILEISKEQPTFSKISKIEHKTIFKNEYLKITKKYKKIIINDCISNIYNIKKFFKKISEALEHKGEIEISHHYGPSIIKNLNIDRVYFEHINNFSYKSLNILVNNYDLQIKSFKLFENKNFFRAILIKKNFNIKNKNLINKSFDLVEKKNIKEFINKINQIKIKLKKDIQKNIYQNKEGHIYGYGASIGSIAVIKFLDLEKYIVRLIDDYTHLRIINMNKKIFKIQKKLPKKNGDLIINLAPRYTSKIRKNIIKNSIKKIFYIEVLPTYRFVKKGT